MEGRNLHLGLDIGFGDVKVVAGVPEGGEASEVRCRKFPSAIAYARSGIIGDLGDEACEKRYNYNGRDFLVGSAALDSPEVFSTRDINFLLSYAPLLAYVALKELSNGSLDLCAKELCVGIPLAYFHSKRQALSEVLRETHVSGESVRFESVEVRAQGQGILFDFMLDGEGRPIAERLDLNLLVLDIGFNTVDLLGVVRGRPSRQWSDMIERGGISRVCEQLGYYLKGEYGFDLSEQSLKDIVRKKEIVLYGATKDLSVVISGICEDYAGWLVQEVASRWDGFLKRADALVLAGGGAYYLQDYFLSRYPEKFVYLPAEPEYANARGFYKYLRGWTNG